VKRKSDLGEHAELRAALGLTAVPDHTALYRFMRCIDDSVLDSILVEAVKRLPLFRRGKSHKRTVAVDATGLAPGAISTFFVNRQRNRGRACVALV
jgi:hypothetical protein